MITWHDVVLAIVGAVAGQTLVLLCWMIVWMRSMRGPLAGWWEDRIFNGHECIKSDIVRLYHVGSHVVGWAARQSSPNEGDCGRRWYFAGRQNGNELFGIFWEISRSAPRNVAMFMTQRDDGHFEGRYLRLHENKRGATNVRIELHRLPQKPNNCRAYRRGYWEKIEWLRLCLYLMVP